MEPFHIATVHDEYTRIQHLGPGPSRGVLLHIAANIGLEMFSQLSQDLASLMFFFLTSFKSASLNRTELHRTIERYVDLTAAIPANTDVQEQPMSIVE
ncbi:MAG: hypothetical protein Q9209_002501 [Squamulea sp. 1 TL-2023]